MDKEKTGKLIKEARIKKNYTQSELGDLLGVSNKAISRWENGDSFPDVGVLENLATILDIPIHDIITGENTRNCGKTVFDKNSNVDECSITDESFFTDESSTGDTSAIIDVVRAVRIQSREKRRNIVRQIIIMILLMLILISGYTSLGGENVFFSNYAMYVYTFFMVVTYTALFINERTTERIADDKSETMQENSSERVKGRSVISRSVVAISVVSMVYSIFLLLLVFILINKGKTPFNMELSKVGPFVNWQLIIVFLLNFIAIIISLYRYERKETNLPRGMHISIAAVYLVSMYGDFIHNIALGENLLAFLLFRTGIVVLGLGIVFLWHKKA